MQPFAPNAKALSGPLPKSATPVKSILKPVPVLRKRKELHHDPDESPVPPESPSKRRQVLFDEIRNVTYEVGNRTMNDFKLEVRRALEEHLRGKDGRYDSLKEMFAKDKKQRHLSPVVGEDDDPLKPGELQAYIMALTSCIPILKGRECNGLVRVILKCSWLGRDQAVVKVFTHFLAALVSAQGLYLAAVLSMMVDKFLDSHPWSWSVSDFADVGRDTMRERLHSTLQYLLQMFPSAVAVLEKLLSAKFPLPEESMRTHMAYIRNLLHVKDYVPDLRDEILDLILNGVVKMDSQMQADLEDVDEDVAAAVMHGWRENQRQGLDWEDDGSDDSDNESVDSDDTDYDQEAARIKTLKDNVQKTDAALDTLFEFYTPHFINPGSDKAFDMFTIILREFDYMVLPTYKSRHTQFLIFHFAQQHERLTDAFCGQLMATAFQGNTPNVLKQAAAAYLASFVARGAHVPRSLVRTMFLLLMHYLEQYRQKYEPLCRGPDLKRFHPYYSLVQATLYIFCFRWQDLVVSAPEMVDADDAASYIGQDLEWLGTSSRDLSVHVFGKLNPLKVCAPVIVDEFAKLAHRLKFMYIYPLLESNKRIRLSQYLTSTYATGGALRDAGHERKDEQLDAYFPFDPYQLPVSRRWLEKDYVHWKSVPGLNAADDDDDSDGGGNDEDRNDQVKEGTATDSDGDDVD